MISLIALGAERTIEQDPVFALRILVDIAIRALSPAFNDPTTAVQVLHGRDWEDYLQLAVSEIRDDGATSMQVCRWLRAALDGLVDSLPAAQHPALEKELELLHPSVERAFTDPARRALAQCADPQGIGGRSRPRR
ncbi:DUF2254 domain-containing protein [Streptomyces canus]|uniref:DUF2254 family protein n=1 Tax=Streptomyces canus TaxID=58343 RepID=UPI0022538DE5|nr:DUF2254 family protein [Streptomyces canus]MCX4853606.1 DUF2254 domain-containing protein [Streptomyces canus]WSW31149.1 DUF2254 domain-containing protein [Streptomyces canus]